MEPGSGDSHMFTFSGIPFCCFLSGVIFQDLPLVRALFFFVTLSISVAALEEGSIKLLSLVARILMCAAICYL